MEKEQVQGLKFRVMYQEQKLKLRFIEWLTLKLEKRFNKLQERELTQEHVNSKEGGAE